jgi:hypothetical protein
LVTKISGNTITLSQPLQSALTAGNCFYTGIL